MAGVLCLAFWISNSFSPYVDAVYAALVQFAGQEVASRFTAPWKTPTTSELQRLATEANFSSIEVSVSRINLHLPRIDKFVFDHLSATPVAADIDAVGDEARRRIGTSVMEQLQRHADGDGTTFPEETFVLTARAG
jgi:hypothetical protein